MPAKKKSPAAPRKKSVPANKARAAPAVALETGMGASNMREEVTAYRKDLILRAARDAFFENGYHDCSVDMIARRLSGSKSIVYYYFPDKHSILRDIYQRALEEALSLMRKAIAEGADPAAKLAAIARYYTQWVIDNQRVVAIFWREVQCLSAEARAAVAVEQKKMDDLLSQTIRQGVSMGQFDVPDVPTAARAIEGMITFTYTWWRGDKRLSRDAAADYYAQMALRHVGFRTS